MYVNPNSTIILCKNVPLDNTYEHTIYFANVGEQTSYFTSKAIVTLNAQTYQRVERGKMRVQVNAESIYTCNYLMFRNTAYGTKWFYAFVTSVEYVNDVTSEITFMLDSLQTYWFDITRKPCYVEREHSATDNIGENLVPEPIAIPQLHIFDKKDWYFDSSHTTWYVDIYVKAPFAASWLADYPAVIYVENQIGCSRISLPVDTPNFQDVLNDLLLDLARGQYEVICGYMVNDDLVMPQPQLLSIALPRPTYFKGYNANESDYTTVKNNKLFTAPFNKLLVTSSEGDSAEYNWDAVDVNNIAFYLYSNSSNTPSCELRPVDYEDASGVRLKTVGLHDFPKVNFTEYSGITPTNLTSAFQKVENGLTAPKHPAEIATQATISSLMNIAFDTGKNVPSTTGSNLDIKFNTYGFQFYTMTLRASDAERIDNFFSKYGYATQKIKVPNVFARANWTYTKTKGCVIVGNAPADDVKKICQIFDNGITFWVDGDNVGNYGDLSNPVAVG